jgi:hypothetical protein
MNQIMQWRHHHSKYFPQKQPPISLQLESQWTRHQEITSGITMDASPVLKQLESQWMCHRKFVSGIAININALPDVNFWNRNQRVSCRYNTRITIHVSLENQAWNRNQRASCRTNTVIAIDKSPETTSLNIKALQVAGGNCDFCFICCHLGSVRFLLPSLTGMELSTKHQVKRYKINDWQDFMNFDYGPSIGINIQRRCS